MCVVINILIFISYLVFIVRSLIIMHGLFFAYRDWHSIIRILFAVKSWSLVSFITFSMLSSCIGESWKKFENGCRGGEPFQGRRPNPHPSHRQQRHRVCTWERIVPDADCKAICCRTARDQIVHPASPGKNKNWESFNRSKNKNTAGLLYRIYFAPSFLITAENCKQNIETI